MQNNTAFAPQFISANNKAKYVIMLLAISIGIDAIDILLGGILIFAESLTADSKEVINAFANERISIELKFILLLL